MPGSTELRIASKNQSNLVVSIKKTKKEKRMCATDGGGGKKAFL